MITKKQGIEYTRIHDQLGIVHKVTEAMWDDIIVFHKEFNTFHKLVEKRMLKRRKMDDVEEFVGNIVSPDTEFLNIYLTSLNTFLLKASKFIENCLAYHEEVKACMQVVLDIHKELGDENIKRKYAGELLTNTSNRINSIEAKIAEAVPFMKTIKKEFVTLQVEYQHCNN